MLKTICLCCLRRPASLAASRVAQSPNTSTIVVVVTDQSGAVVKDATVVGDQHPDRRRARVASGADGSATFPALPLTGTYTVARDEAGLRRRRRDRTSRSAPERRRRCSVKLLVGIGARPRSPSTAPNAGRARRRADRPPRSTARRSTRRRSSAARSATVPLLNSAFRQGKGTGDLFVNATYFVTGAGSRRTTTFMLDGVNNDEGWGRQTMLSTLPLGAVQEMSHALERVLRRVRLDRRPGGEHRHQVGHQRAARRRRSTWPGPAAGRRRPSRTDGFCPPSVSTCTTPATLTAINPADVPDALNQVSGSIGARAGQGQDVLLRRRRLHAAGSDDVPVERRCRRSCCRPTATSPTSATTARGCSTPASITSSRRADADGAVQLRPLLRHQPERRRRRHQRAERRAPLHARLGDRRRRTSPSVVELALSQRGALRLSRRRSGDAVGSAGPLDHATRAPARCRSRSAQSRPADTFSRQLQLVGHAVVVARQSHLRLGGSLARHTSGGFGNEPGFAVLGTFTFLNTTTAPFDQLTLADVQNYSQPVSYGITTYDLNQWLIAGVRAGQRPRQQRSDARSRPALRPSDADRREERTSRRASASAGIRTAIRVSRSAAATAMYYTQIQANLLADALTGGLDGFTTYTATPGQSGFPTCLTAPCVPVPLDPRTLPASQLPARNITIRAGDAAFYRTQFAQYGLNFDLLPNYPGHAGQPAQPGGVDRRRARDRARAVRSAPTTCTSTGPISIAPSI